MDRRRHRGITILSLIGGYLVMALLSQLSELGDILNTLDRPHRLATTSSAPNHRARLQLVECKFLPRVPRTQAPSSPVAILEEPRIPPVIFVARNDSTTLEIAGVFLTATCSPRSPPFT